LYVYFYQRMATMDNKADGDIRWFRAVHHTNYKTVNEVISEINILLICI